MMNMLKNEMRYFVKSKELAVFLLLFAFISALNIYLNYKSAIDNYNEYKYQYDCYISYDMTEEEINDDIERGYTIISQDKSDFQSSEMIENPLLYCIEATQKNANNFAPVNMLSLIIEPLLVISSIFVTFLGTISITDDIGNRTIRNHVLRHGKTKYILLKTVSSVLKNLIVIFITIILSLIACLVVYKKLCTQITGIDITAIDLNKSNYVMQIFVLIASVIFYSVIGVFLGTIFRKSYICLILVLIKSFIPFNFKYGLTNIFNHFISKIYIFEGNFVHLSNVEEMSNSMLLIPIASIALIITFLLIFFKKRSAY